MWAAAFHTVTSSSHTTYKKNKKLIFPAFFLARGRMWHRSGWWDLGRNPRDSIPPRLESHFFAFIPPPSSYMEQRCDAWERAVIWEQWDTSNEDKGLHAKDGKDIGKQSLDPNGVSKNHVGPSGLPWTSCHIGQQAPTRLCVNSRGSVTFSNGGKERRSKPVLPLRNHTASRDHAFSLPISPQMH